MWAAAGRWKYENAWGGSIGKRESSTVGGGDIQTCIFATFFYWMWCYINCYHCNLGDKVWWRGTVHGTFRIAVLKGTVSRDFESILCSKHCILTHCDRLKRFSESDKRYSLTVAHVKERREQIAHSRSSIWAILRGRAKSERANSQPPASVAFTIIGSPRVRVINEFGEYLTQNLKKIVKQKENKNFTKPFRLFIRVFRVFWVFWGKN